MVGRWLAFSAVVASTMFVAGRAWCADPIELVYLRSGKAAICPEKATLAQAIGKRLGYQPFFAAAERKLIAEISSKGSVLHARATLVDRNGVVRGDRQLTAPVGECGELIASLALAISITLDPMSTGAEATAPSIPIEATSATPPATERAEPRAESLPNASDPNAKRAESSSSMVEHSDPNADIVATNPVSPNRNLRLDASVGMSAIVGSLPSMSPALRLGVGMARDWAAISVEFTGTPAISQAGPAAAEADMSLLFGSVVPCAMFGRIGACALISLGRWQGEGHNVEAPRAESHFYGAAGLRVTALLPLTGPLHLRFYAGGAATVTRPSFELLGTEVWRPPFLSVDAGAAVAFYFL